MCKSSYTREKLKTRENVTGYKKTRYPGPSQFDRQFSDFSWKKRPTNACMMHFHGVCWVCVIRKIFPRKNSKTVSFSIIYWSSTRKIGCWKLCCPRGGSRGVTKCVCIRVCVLGLSVMRGARRHTKYVGRIAVHCTAGFESRREKKKTYADSREKVCYNSCRVVPGIIQPKENETKKKKTLEGQTLYLTHITTSTHSTKKIYSTQQKPYTTSIRQKSAWHDSYYFLCGWIIIILSHQPDSSAISSDP